MDIKLKNNSSTRKKIAVIGLIIITLVTICFFPAINKRGSENAAYLNQSKGESVQVDANLVREIYQGCYVLNLERIQRKENLTGSDVYLEVDYAGSDDEKAERKRELKSWADGTLEALGQTFEMYRSQIDYCIFLEAGEYEKNTTQPLEAVFDNTLAKNVEEQLSGHYNNYFILEFDENGVLEVEMLYSSNTNADALVKAFGQADRGNELWEEVEREYKEYGLTCKMKKPSGFTVAFGVPKNADYQFNAEEITGTNSDYWTLMNAYADAGAQTLYGIALLLIAGMAIVLTSKKVWKTDIPMNRPGNWYLMEAALTAGIFVQGFNTEFMSMIWNLDLPGSYSELFGRLTGKGAMVLWTDLFETVLILFLVYAAWYLCVLFIRPVFSLGVREYVRQYSFFYQIFPWLKNKWKQLVNEIRHIDFSEKSVKTIVKIVVINFFILAVISCFWFFGIGALIGYSIAVFFLIKNYYDKAGRDYQALLRRVSQIADGNLDVEIAGDLGVFEPFKGQLAQIQSGFKKAVDEEVKSQRMKTELITNVSHDLKTPLTAITTYVELLKKEDITEEERRSYIETLEKKSLRLKVLIEDLFEVSKASSNNITLDLMEVDVANLLKQVSVEHKDKFDEAGLDLRWNLPEEKIVLMLDNQKTYRIFENLFVNIKKYAMPQSRVYIDLKKIDVTGSADDGNQPQECETYAEITLKNMSANELNFKAEEITERFVRGDASRNTEGSGLGLAIAKSFTEAQGGKFTIEVDGDLFKVVIRWKCDTLQVDNA